MAIGKLQMKEHKFVNVFDFRNNEYQQQIKMQYYDRVYENNAKAIHC